MEITKMHTEDISMQIASTKEDLEELLAPFREASASIGFVPTMGALHKGHTSLIEQSMKTCDVTVCSIFVNPTQFNNADDLKTYPNTLDADINLLNSVNCDVLFLPSSDVIYPGGVTVSDHFDFGGLDDLMEGRHRPGHFAGVAQVVKTLLELVEPDCLFLGQKDYQQFCILRRMVELLRLSVNVVSCPIVREPDGLAMSSRNLRLDEQHRKAAPLISQTLQSFVSADRSRSLADLKAFAIEQINADPMLECEYLVVADAVNLQSVEKWDEAEKLVVCTSVWAGDVRLIDNVLMD